MAITSLPTPPSRSDPENFAERADAFMAALPRFATEANTLQEHVNEAAATVDQDAAAAAQSRDAAAESRGQASQSAVNADLARQAAAQKAGEAGASALLAQQWATKMGAPVEGDGFSAKHYAQLAAIGAGLPVYMPGSVPSQNVGPIYIVGRGNAEWEASTGRYRVHSDIPVGAVAWWPLRSSIPVGRIPADGQTVSRATFPDLAAMVAAGTVPVVPEADWLADPLKRGSYTQGDGSTTIRVPDMNGQSAGAVGALFLRGDGALSAGTSGLLQRDAMQLMQGVQNVAYGVVSGPGNGVFSGSRGGDGSDRSATSYSLSGASGHIRFDNSFVARTAAENRPSNVSGVWTIQAFGAVTNPGEADAAQLASDYAALNAAFQTLTGQIGFAVLYPGGTSSNPGVIAKNTRMVVANPFPGFAVHVVPEHLLVETGAWCDPGWYSAAYTGTGDSAWGLRAGQFNNGDIFVTAGQNGTAIRIATLGGHGFPNFSANQDNAYFRLKVWKIRGQV